MYTTCNFKPALFFTNKVKRSGVGWVRVESQPLLRPTPEAGHMLGYTVVALDTFYIIKLLVMPKLNH